MKSKFLYVLLIALPSLAKAQTYNVSVMGPFSASVGETYAYYAQWRNQSGQLTLPPSGTHQWMITLNGSLESSNASSCEIQWNSSGTGWVSYEYNTWNNYYYADFPVMIVGPPVAPILSPPSNVTSSAFTASWNGVMSATGYYIDVATNSTFTSLVSGYNNKAVDGTNIVVSGLAGGTTYYYRVRATNTHGTSGNSNVRNATTKPSAPAANAASSIATTSFTANWSGETGATSYRLDVSTTSNFSSMLSGYNNLSVSATSRSVTGLSAGTTYYYRVRAVGSSGTSASSNTRTVETKPVAPAANAGSSITASSFTAGWGSVPSADSYRLDVSTTSSFSSFISGYNNLTVSGTSRSVTGLSSGTTYYYRVRAVNSGGASANSNTPSGILTKPAPPVANSGTSVATGSFTANWTAVTSATSYRLDVSTTSSFSSFVSGYNNLTVSGTSRAVTGLNPGTTYHYRVRAVNGSGTSGNSNTRSVLTVPGAPTAVAAASVAASSFTADWNSIASATSYRLDISTASNFSSFVSGYNNLSVTGTSRSVTGLANGTTYYYRVRAVNGSGTSANSNTVTVLTRPAAPGANAASAINPTSFTANWSSVTSATSYRLDVSAESDFSPLLSSYNNLVVSGTSRSVTGLNAGTTYYYRVRAANGSGTSANSNTRQVLTDPAAPTLDPHSSMTTTSFTANWNGVTSATSYRIDVSTASNFSSFLSGYNNATVSGTSTGISGLSAGTTYYFRVRAVNGSGASPSSATGTALTKPGAPSASAASSVAAGSFTANWSAVPSATSYRLDVSTSSSFSTFVSGYNNLSVTGTSRSVTGMSAGTTYYYRVRAVNGTGTSASSGARSVLTLPAAPAANAESAVNTTSFTANWGGAASATSYRLDVSTSSTFSNFVSGYNNLTVSGTTRSVTGLTGCTTYYYRVRAVNGSGTSASSGSQAALTKPAAPALQNESNVSVNSFTVNWTAMGCATNYRLDVSTASNFASLVSGYSNLTVDGSAHVVTGLSPGTMYYYRLRAVNATGASPNSSTGSALTRPDEPVAGAASAITTGSFTANWNSVPSATSYRLDVSTSAAFSGFVSGYNNLTVSGTSHGVTGLSGCTTYYYRIRAVNGTGTSANSNTASVLTEPPTPGSESVSGITATSFTVNWTDMPCAASYRIDVSTASNFSGFVPGYNNLAVTNPPVVVTGLTSGATYYFRLRAVNATGASPSGLTGSAQTLPAAPAANAAGSLTTNSFNASWNAVASATNYLLDVSTASSFSTFVSGYQNLSVTGTNRSITGLTPGDTYYYRVRAVNGTGTSANSNTISTLMKPGPPTANAASGINPTAFTANWTSTLSATGYVLDVATDAGFTSFVTGYSGKAVTGTSHAVTGLTGGTNYYYRVRTVNGSGTSVNSNAVHVLTDPVAPILSPAADITTSSFTASWNAVPSATGYRLDLSTVNTFSTFVTGYQNLTVNDASQPVTGLAPGTTYYYRVRAVNASGTSANSATATVLTKPDAPVAGAPTGVGGASFTANWSAVSSATGYLLDVATDVNFTSLVIGYDALSATGTTHGVTGLANGTTYFYRVRSVNASGISANSNYKTALTRPATPVLADPAFITTTSLSVSWNAVLSADSYRLDVSPDSEFSTFVTGYHNVTVMGTDESVTGLDPGTKYYVRVHARNATGASAHSATRSAATMPAVPEVLPATNVTAQFFTASWTASGSDGTSYRLDVSRHEAFTDFVAGYEDLAVAGTSTVVTGLRKGTTYYYRVRAVNESGITDNSSVMVTTTDEFVALYNGLITSARWRTDKAYGVAGASDLEGMYLYSYDDKYQLRAANWAEANDDLNTFTRQGNKFKVINPAYDPNGNILALQRYDGSGALQHNFGYTYNSVVTAPKNNQLEKIDGYATYDYDLIGRLTTEDRVDGEDKYIEYDVSGKVRKVYSSPAKTAADLKVENIYDDRGFRLAKVNHEENRTTWYIRDASGNIISVHEQEGVVSYDAAGVPLVKTEPLDMVEVPVYGSGKLGTFYPGQDGSMAYEITDHLGNVRALFRENVSIFTATMEDNGSAELSNPRVRELAFFQNITETAVTDVNMNHSIAMPGIVPAPDKSAYLFWQDGVAGMEATDNAIGPATALRVSQGDEVELETWVRFKKMISYTRDVDLLLLSSLLGNNVSALPMFDGANPTQVGTSFNTGLGSLGFGGDDADDTRPYAYLNYVLFRDDYTVMDAGWQRVPAEAGFDAGEEGLEGMHQRVSFENPIPVTENGYIYVWVSNESEDTEVWFDDLKVTHTGTFVAQATDYGAWGDVLREQRTDERKYRFGYQGQFAEKDEETGWNHFELREYDAVVGRWTVVDPKRVGFTPYSAMGNNPIALIDSDGGEPDDIRIYSPGNDQPILVLKTKLFDQDIYLDHNNLDFLQEHDVSTNRLRAREISLEFLDHMFAGPAAILSAMPAGDASILTASVDLAVGSGDTFSLDLVHFDVGDDKGQLHAYWTRGFGGGWLGGGSIAAGSILTMGSKSNFDARTLVGYGAQVNVGAGWLSLGAFTNDDRTYVGYFGGVGAGFSGSASYRTETSYLGRLY